MPRRFDPLQPELMDLPQPVSEELRRDLANLVSLNRHFGAHSHFRRFLKPILDRHDPARPLRLLDLCTGAADLPRLAVDLARPRQIDLRATAVDRHPSTLAIAEGWSGGYPEISFHVGDALAGLPPDCPPFDVVTCSLALHHFSTPDAIALLRAAGEAAAPGAWCWVADLRRSPLLTLGIHLVTATLYRDPMTVADARTSAARAFSAKELRQLAAAAGLPPHRHSTAPIGRQAITFQKP